MFEEKETNNVPMLDIGNYEVLVFFQRDAAALADILSRARVGKCSDWRYDPKTSKVTMEHPMGTIGIMFAPSESVLWPTTGTKPQQPEELPQGSVRYLE